MQGCLPGPTKLVINRHQVGKVQLWAVEAHKKAEGVSNLAEMTSSLKSYHGFS